MTWEKSKVSMEEILGEYTIFPHVFSTTMTSNLSASPVSVDHRGKANVSVEPSTVGSGLGLATFWISLVAPACRATKEHSK